MNTVSEYNLPRRSAETGGDGFLDPVVTIRSLSWSMQSCSGNQLTPLSSVADIARQTVENERRGGWRADSVRAPDAQAVHVTSRRAFGTLCSGGIRRCSG